MRALFATLFILAFLTGCSPGQEGHPTTSIVIDTPEGPAKFMVEVAADKASREKGLMYRTKLAPDAGMLFDFREEEFQVFWMKNTPLPLDMLFIRADGTISTIAENAVPYSLDPIQSSEPVRAVLEIRGGRAQALGIQPGNKVHAAIFGNGP
jgi:uncharacterized membrane protein (UPF0127 family)